MTVIEAIKADIQARQIDRAEDPRQCEKPGCEAFYDAAAQVWPRLCDYHEEQARSSRVAKKRAEKRAAAYKPKKCWVKGCRRTYVPVGDPHLPACDFHARTHKACQYSGCATITDQRDLYGLCQQHAFRGGRA